MSKKVTPIVERFFQRFTAPSDEACWEWTGPKSHFGHGKMREFGAGSREIRAHRVSYELFIGPIKDGQFVCHKCDNPSCVNPAHLYAGTQADNMRDKRVRNRQKGELSGIAKLNDQNVRAIKAFLRRHPPGHGRREGGQCGFLARWFGVTKYAISDIYRGKCWNHIL